MEANPLVRIDMYGVPWVDRGECGEKPVDWPVMQYTGLKDKNGKEIYESDIVEVHWPKGMDTYVVKWQNKSDYHLGCWEFTSTANPHHYTGSAGSAVEVIGNIYENPELLEGEDV